jgi:predicted extracellular nuclease
VLAQPLAGEARPFTPTALASPGAPAQARALANTLSRITLDDGLSIQNPDVHRHPNGSPFSLNNRFRGGDTVGNTTGVIGFDFGVYRIHPIAPADYTAVNVRPPAPPDVGGTLQVAAMNTLNFFLTPNYPTGSPLDNRCGPGRNLECRGADFDQPMEFSRQRDKLIAALAGLDADIVGLNEIENTAGVEPLGDPALGVVAGLNAVAGAGVYDYVDTGVIGSDAIRVGLIYKTGKVLPVGPFAVLTTSVDPRFLDTKNRPALAQTFESVANGARITIAVNHLKSKGSACADVSDPDTGDGQGNCNRTRTAAAQALLDWLAGDPTGSGDGDVLIVGDLNSYAKEDPVSTILAGADDTPGTGDDYTNLIAHYQGPFAYSYVFDGQAGYLDHALASQSLAGQTRGAVDWHVNADEPDLLDYDMSFKPPAQEVIYEANAYRSSDHDAVKVGLELLRYDFAGFSRLVTDASTLNHANAGSSVPVHFRVPAARSADIFMPGFPQSQQTACGARVPLGAPEPVDSPGRSSMRRDAASNEFNFVWKTNKTWGGTCRRFRVMFKDGSTHDAHFAFK